MSKTTLDVLVQKLNEVAKETAIVERSLLARDIHTYLETMTKTEARIVVNNLRSEGVSLMTHAAKLDLTNGNTLLEYLVEEVGADVNIVDQSNHTPLYYMILNGNIHTKYYLGQYLKTKVAKFSSDDEVVIKQNPDALAIYKLIKDVKANDKIKALDKTSPIPITHADLNRAIDSGDCFKMDFLFEKMKQNYIKVDVNTPAPEQELPLIYAIKYADSLPGTFLDMIKYLVEDFRANVNVTDQDGHSPLFYALKLNGVLPNNQFFELINYLTKNKALLNRNEIALDKLMNCPIEASIEALGDSLYESIEILDDGLHEFIEALGDELCGLLNCLYPA